MSKFSSWLEAPGLNLHRGRQSLSDAEHDEILSPLSTGSKTAIAITSLRAAVFSGEKVNRSEGRAAGHWALRAAGLSQSDAQNKPLSQTASSLITGMIASQDQAKFIATSIRSGKLQSSSGRPYRHIVHLGIGGSDLGPQLLLTALADATGGSPCQAVFLSNLDYHGTDHLLARLDPAATCVIIVSKSFQTQETMANAAHLLEWMRNAQVAAPETNFIGVTAVRERAVQWGIHENHVLTFDESIGGRYSLWGPVSLVARIILGNDLVDRFLQGGVMMDQHFLEAALPQNLPAVLAATDFYNLRRRQIPTLMVSAYDSRLSLLVPYLKQLWMESLGKHLAQNGQPIDGPACPILWGDIGTNAQHAFFQLLHQGAQGVAVELIGVVKPSHAQEARHKALLANLVAQAQALAIGKTQSDPTKNCWGGHPVNLTMIDTLTPESLGSLLALWEHRVLCLAAMTGVNPFDQWGVELGKSIATDAEKALKSASDPVSDQLDDVSRELLTWIQKRSH